MQNLKTKSLEMVKDYLEGLKFAGIIPQAELGRLYEVINELEDARNESILQNNLLQLLKNKGQK